MLNVEESSKLKKYYTFLGFKDIHTHKTYKGDFLNYMFSKVRATGNLSTEDFDYLITNSNLNPKNKLPLFFQWLQSPFQYKLTKNQIDYLLHSAETEDLNGLSPLLLSLQIYSMNQEGRKKLLSHHWDYLIEKSDLATVDTGHRNALIFCLIIETQRKEKILNFEQMSKLFEHSDYHNFLAFAQSADIKKATLLEDKIKWYQVEKINREKNSLLQGLEGSPLNSSFSPAPSSVLSIKKKKTLKL